MKKYLIKREMPGISQTPQDKLEEAGKNSESVLVEMRSEGKGINQVQSYIAGDCIFCVYQADSTELIHEHGERSHFPVTEISEISDVVEHDTSGQ
ncbi:MAG: hypothetical protein CMD29_02850 [Flavobacteriales bacterium]|jgi:hypothetical protein|nr:hypothetical protein [Flavobacteriales bacterium]|tara:strand:+ start:746 stop:1030 length:285 start_codon:yes stop_codon:yes gene_type:complete